MRTVEYLTDCLEKIDHIAKVFQRPYSLQPYGRIGRLVCQALSN